MSKWPIYPLTERNNSSGLFKSIAQADVISLSYLFSPFQKGLK